MKKIILAILLSHLLLLIASSSRCVAQYIGFGTSSPLARLHIKGSIDTSQLVIDAFVSQSNNHPLINLRTSNGIELLRIHADDPKNIFIGQFAGRVNNASTNGGTFNTFIGGAAGFSNVNGYFNTSVGQNALYSNTNGFNNTALGSHSLYSTTIGLGNTGIGYSAMRNSVTGLENTAIGSTSLYGNSSGRSNTSVGKDALLLNTTGSYNSAAGHSALNANTTGINNTIFGHLSMLGNTGGNNNTVTGAESLYKNPLGNGNTISGLRAYNFQNGNSGDQNTGIGSFSLLNALTSSYNTVFGAAAGSGTIYYMGWNNTLVGGSAVVNGPALFNTIALGASAASLASNQARIGNSSASSIGGYVSWTNISDGRVKKNIKNDVPGLLFINKLSPVTYTLDLEMIDRLQTPVKHEGIQANALPLVIFERDARLQKEQIVYSGFIAQAVETAAKTVGYDFSGVDAAKNENDLYGLRYEDFVVPLVKVAQELSQRHTELLKRVEQLEALLKAKK